MTYIKAPAKKTKDCFKDFEYRDSDLNAWLPKEQPATEGEVTVIERTKEQTFLEMAQEYLGTTDTKQIAKHALTLPMVEKLIENADANGLRTDGYHNFFFVEDNDGGVSVASVDRGDSRWFAYVDRHGSRWHAFVFRLGLGGRWYTDYRLLIRNLDAKTLGRSGPVSDLEERVARLEKWVEGVRSQLL